MLNIHDFTMEKTIELVKEKYMELASRCDQIDVFGMSMGGALATWVTVIIRLTSWYYWLQRTTTLAQSLALDG